MASDYIEHKLALLPDMPGCYLMKNINGKIIYVGKAKNLKNRVQSYFKSSHDGKTARLVSEIADFEYIVVSSDKEAFLLEITLIQKHRPYFNIKLKQGNGGYPYIKITNERDPQIKIVNTLVKDGGFYLALIQTFMRRMRRLTFYKKFIRFGAAMDFRTGPASTITWGSVWGPALRSSLKRLMPSKLNGLSRF